MKLSHCSSSAYYVSIDCYCVLTYNNLLQHIRTILLGGINWVRPCEFQELSESDHYHYHFNWKQRDSISPKMDAESVNEYLTWLTVGSWITCCTCTSIRIDLVVARSSISARAAITFIYFCWRMTYFNAETVFWEEIWKHRIFFSKCMVTCFRQKHLMQRRRMPIVHGIHFLLYINAIVLSSAN